MQNNVLRMALGIYEQEILFFGGTVNYTGQIAKKGLFSKIEEAEVTLKNVRCRVLMERYRDGSAVIYDSGEDYSMLFRTFYSISQNSAKHLSYYFFRRTKFFFLGLLQLCSIVAAFLSVFFMVRNGISLLFFILLLTAVVLFFLVDKFYSYVRTESIFAHTSFLLTHKSNDETDDFWNAGN